MKQGYLKDETRALDLFMGLELTDPQDVDLRLGLSLHFDVVEGNLVI